MSWFLQQFVNAVLNLVVAVLTYVISQIVMPLGLTPTVIEAYFPSITGFVSVFKILGIFILIILVLISLFRSILGDGSYAEKDNPAILVFRALIALSLILMSMSFMNYLYSAIGKPFYLLTDDNGVKAFDVVNDENSVFGDSISDVFTDFVNRAGEDQEEYQSTVDKIKDWIFPGVAILKSLIELIAIGFIGFKFVGLILKILERYFLLMLQTYLSPLAFSVIATKSTTGIFRKWGEMLISNFILVYLNFFFLGLIVNGMKNMFSPGSALEEMLGYKPNFLLGCASTYIMIKIAGSIDMLVNRLLTTASSPSGLGQEIYFALSSFNRGVKTVIHTITGGTTALAEAGSGLTQTMAEQITEKTDTDTYHNNQSDKVNSEQIGSQKTLGGLEKSQENYHRGIEQIPTQPLNREISDTKNSSISNEANQILQNSGKGELETLTSQNSLTYDNAKSSDLPENSVLENSVYEKLKNLKTYSSQESQSSFEKEYPMENGVQYESLSAQPIGMETIPSSSPAQELPIEKINGQSEYFKEAPNTLLPENKSISGFPRTKEALKTDRLEVELPKTARAGENNNEAVALNKEIPNRFPSTNSLENNSVQSLPLENQGIIDRTKDLQKEIIASSNKEEH